jgi:type I restriction enzyme S subunit
MNKVFPYVKLKNLCEVNQGLQISIEDRYNTNGPNRYFYITVQFLKDSHKNKFFVKNPPLSSICSNDDILIVRTGSTGQIVTNVSGCFHNNFFKVNFNKELLHGRYLYHCLRTKEKYNEMLRRAGVTTIPDLNHFMFLDIEIPLPEINKQIGISKTLDALDAKIEVNNRINAELEAMAKTLYDYWFVQFDFPDENGKPYKSSGGKMVWSDELKREIPQGWEVGMLFDVMDVQYGFPFSTAKFTDEITDIPIVRIRDIINNTISTYTTEIVDEKYRLLKNDLLIGMDGNFHLNFWDKNGAYLNQRSVRIRSKNESNIANFQAYFQLKPYIKAKENNVSRTTVGHLSDKDLKRLYLLIPNCNEKFQPKKIFDEQLSKITSNRIENQKLAEIRDWLLPMLMNGQVRVED